MTPNRAVPENAKMRLTGVPESGRKWTNGRYGRSGRDLLDWRG
ncbi:MAG TPA: hypothetical protein VJN64_10945 [Terriglobales bacterium]|nr:hypothetical protein [Terriglobales bacterium]